MVLIATESRFIMDLLWLSSVVDKRELLAPWWDNIEDGNVAVSFTFFSRYSLLRGHVCGFKEGNAFSENSLSLNINGWSAE